MGSYYNLRYIPYLRYIGVSGLTACPSSPRARGGFGEQRALLSSGKRQQPTPREMFFAALPALGRLGFRAWGLGSIGFGHAVLSLGLGVVGVGS